MGDFVERGAAHRAELRIRQPQERAQRDFREREYRTHDSYGRHCHDFVIASAFLFGFRHGDGTRQPHDGRGTANTCAARGEDGEMLVDAEFSGDEIGDGDGECDDDRRHGDGFDPGGEQHVEVEFETEQDDAQPQQFVGNQCRGVADAFRTLGGGVGEPCAHRDLHKHADDQCDDERAEQAEHRQAGHQGPDDGRSAGHKRDKQHLSGAYAGA